jgi:threonine dehydratase
MSRECTPPDTRDGRTRVALPEDRATDTAGQGIDPMSAARRLAGLVVRSPVRELPWLERLLGVPVFAKLEMQQHTGSFKYRGALNAVLAGPRKPIIAASAGNHGLAVAEVARRLGRPANICIPATASPLKREHILATGAGLIEHGNSLEDAADRAMQLAAEQDLLYLSPYNDPHVVAGAATIALEMLEDCPEITTLVAPVGGGGLISGLALGARAAGASVQVFGCEPERYQSVSASLNAGRIVRVVHQPTIADGLAVNLEAGSITYPLVRRYVRAMVSLTEEELAAATLALLVHESLLVEPAGAAAVAACLRLSEQGLLAGPVGIPLCGGNLQHAALARIQRYPYADARLIRLLELRGRTVNDVPVSRTLSMRHTVSTLPPEPDDTLADMLEQLASWTRRLTSVQADLEEYEQYCAKAGVLVDHGVIAKLHGNCADARERIAVMQGVLTLADNDENALPAAEMILRYAANVTASSRAALEWCSPSYAQATVSQFFDIGAQESPGVNYERYQNLACHEVEDQMREVLGLSPEHHAVIATSSGMAAYALIEAFLLRQRLLPGSTVLMAPYIYFEASEQLRSLPSVTCVQASSYDVQDLLEEVRRHRPRCVFADPIANTAEQRLIDIPALVQGLARVADEPITVVIDGTMVSGALPANLLSPPGQVEVLYYESCSKYLQLGMDAAMAGVVAVPATLRPAFDRLRRNTGGILYRQSAHLFPGYSQAYFRQRMRRICGNAASVAVELTAREDVGAVARVVHPACPGHPDHGIAARMPYVGGCVTFAFHEVGANHREQLDALIEDMLHRARRCGLHLTKGVSFGFNTPRVSAAASMSESEPAFLRLYAGNRVGEQVRLLAQVAGDALASAQAWRTVTLSS